MGKKRIIVEVPEDQYNHLVGEARALSMTLANYVRRALHLPLERQGVKGLLSAPKKAAAKRRKG